KNDFVEASEKILTSEMYLSLKYLQKLGKIDEDEMNKFVVHVLFDKSIDTENYVRKNIESLENIKVSIKNLLQIKNIVYAEHKINLMGNRIFQRIINFYVFYNKKLSINDFIIKEHVHTRFWLHEISGILSDTNLNIRDYYVGIQERLDNDSVIKNSLDENGIHNMTCRIMQFLGDSLFVDSSDYSDLVQIK
ncbi:hypothetical protein HEP_00489000, partial [Hepatocystis sp. ex Piliocolobus tephrosceles]